MIVASRYVAIPDGEFEITAIHAQGIGGQHVNRTSTAIHLRFDIRTSSLPGYYKERLLATSHHLISSDGVIVIKAQEYRDQEFDREVALARLVTVIKNLTTEQKARRPIQPTRTSKERRLASKTQKSSMKVMRNKVCSDREWKEGMDGERNNSDSDDCNQPLYSSGM